MTKEEILSAISGTIEGQGNQVDIGGKLADVLKGIVDLIPEPGADVVTIEVLSFSSESESEEEVLARLEINGETPTKEQLIELVRSNNILHATYNDGDDIVSLVYVHVFSIGGIEDGAALYFGGSTSGFGETGYEVLITLNGNDSSVKWNEI